MNDGLFSLFLDMNHYDVTVFGAGISGTAIANALSVRGRSVLLVDPNTSENAPGPPAALVNPATGRFATMSWEAAACMQALRDFLDTLQVFDPSVVCTSETGVLRPAITPVLADGFRESLDKYDWPKGWIRWMDKDEVAHLNPYTAPNEGALFLDVGYTVFVDKYLQLARRYLRTRGVRCEYRNASYRTQNSNTGFEIVFEDGEVVQSDKVIVAAGHQTPFFKDWEYLPLHRVKGQITVFQADVDLNWEYGTSAMGYCLRVGPRGLIVGSTYEHNFENLDATDTALRQIRNKLKKVYPSIADKAEVVQQMAGARVTTPNKLPVIGNHPVHADLFIYSALGSKGFLFSHHVANILADHICHDVVIPDELSTRRFD